MESDARHTPARAAWRVLGPSRRVSERHGQNLPCRAGSALLAVLLALLLAGQSAKTALAAELPPPPFEPATTPKKKETPAKKDDKKRDDNKKPAQQQADRPAPGASWVIVLAAFRGDGAQAAAAQALAEARITAGLTDAFVETRGDNVIVAYGRFAAPDDPAAADALQRVRGVTVGQAQPYAGAFLAPPFTLQLGSRPEYNLLTAKARYGDDALYTLQVAVYGRDDLPRPTEEDLKEARKAAEEYATTLRQQGELAFYYHGPNRSMVTIGVFTLDDFDPQTPGYQSARLRETRKRFPHNLYNGAGIRISRPGRKPELQASLLVNIPDPPTTTRSLSERPR